MKPEDQLYEEAKLVIGNYKSYFLTETEYTSVKEAKSNKKPNKRILKVLDDLNKSAINLENLINDNLSDDVKDEVRIKLSEFSMFIMKLRELPILIS